MGKSRCFLGIFVSLFMVFFVGSAAFAAGYNCPTYKKYTSCSDGYYMIYPKAVPETRQVQNYQMRMPRLVR